MSAPTLTASSPEAAAFLAAEDRKELLRFLTCGSVDDGKSTLIGRLLYDTQGAYEDQLASIRKSSVNRSSGPIDFSLLTDGLRAEREQGITIDVAYRYFATPRRKFIIADTPGHEQYTRNMATGASTCQLAIILIDARQGVLRQSRRHAYIVSLLGIPNIVVAVNKMDLVGHSLEVFQAIESEFRGFLSQLGINDAQFIPVSALDGDNVAFRGSNTPWYTGPTLLEHLETVPVVAARTDQPLRFPVQYVIRPDLDFRGYAGQIASGVVKAGDAITVLPSGRSTRVKSIVTFDGDLESAEAPRSVTICLEDEVDISRGDMLTHAGRLPEVSSRIDAAVVWMHETPLEVGRTYLLKHTSRQVQAIVRAVRYQTDIHTLDRIQTERLGLNDIGTVLIETSHPLYFDAYRDNRATGSFILIDPLSNATIAAGMIQANAATRERARTEEYKLSATPITTAERQARFGHPGAIIGLPVRPEVAWLLERKLFYHGCVVQVITNGTFEAAETLRQAGLLVLYLPTPNEDSRAYDVAFDATLPTDDETAAQFIREQLEHAGWVAPADEFLGGEGI